MAPSPKAQYRKLPDSLIPKGDLRDKLSSQIVTTIAELPIVIRANHLATFASREHEPDLRGLWERFRSACTFPKILGDEIRFFPISRWEDLRPGPLGILEPPEHTAPTVFQERDVILVPGKCFGPQGERIGSGKGYYDRFLASLPSTITKIGVAWDFQYSRSPLPQEPFDIKIDHLCTERGMRRVG
ncbi:MAG: 5-formyltetrahydrofolate cyclo-ligase [Deltaproteobacteria bacterium]|nr:5-formyltetrahydrofolate cyclo-ligase [Deltaproteobacteria bacterium]